MRILALTAFLVLASCFMVHAWERVEPTTGPYPGTFYMDASDSSNANEVTSVRRISPLLVDRDFGDGRGKNKHEVTVTEVNPPPDALYTYSINPAIWQMPAE